ncbi:MAG: TonB-dependent receptor [Bacteroidia bacterium]|nr:TonB-dependent receptor [Bacteroidia bacterium]
MKQLSLITLLIILGLSSRLLAQTGIIQGRVENETNNQAIAFATVFVQNTELGAYADSAGNFEISGLSPGLFNLEVSAVGFETRIYYEIQVTNNKPVYMDLSLKEDNKGSDSVFIVASPFKKSEEAPVSLRTIGTNEIQRNPGGNRDISKVIQSLPGVGSTVSFRNDILIRGGAPNENRFYLDDIEVPNINHFATQGGSGGPVGMINVDFINEVDFYSGAFPANRGNSLSSVFQFRQREARKDRTGFTATLGASDLALTVEGPSGKNSSYLLSVRRSYLQLLFKALELPFLPTYHDWQYKHKFKLGKRSELNLMSLGSYDLFKLNLEDDSTEFQKYVLGYLPVQTQWSYTVGSSYKYFGDKGFWTVALSRNMINFRAFKYKNNDESQTKLLDYTSQESENKLRVEHTARYGNWKINFGAGGEYDRYLSDTYNQLPFGLVDFESRLRFFRYGAFGQVSNTVLNNRLTLSAGARIDGSSYSSKMSNPFKQFSPRFSASWAFNEKLTANFNTGIYYQLPTYTVMGYRKTEDKTLENKDRLEYIRNNHIVGGFAYVTPTNSKISIEGFYKGYQNYPFLLRDSLSLANFGGDFGIVGNEPANSDSKGRTYGLEVLAQQRLFKGFYGIVAYTLVWSEFTDKRGNYVPSAWDSRHIVTLTAGKKFAKNWELGAKWRFQTGAPFTPTDSLTSSLTSVWNSVQQGVPNYDLLNTQRLKSFHRLDLRVDKKWFFTKWNLNLYFDMQNVYNYKIPAPSILNVRRDSDGQPLVNPDNPAFYQTYFIPNDLGIIQPTVGIVVSY